MSSRSKGKSSKRSERSATYPTAWSDWSWNEQYKCQSRYRLKAENDYEYEYDYSPEVSTITQGLAATSLNSIPDSPTNRESPNKSRIHVKTRDPHTTAEEFLPNYKVHGSWEFAEGRVFKTLWTAASKYGEESESEIEEDWYSRYGTKHCERIRRFVVVQQNQGHCFCLSINTYGGQGVLKRGIVRMNHAIIYTERQPLKGEDEYGDLLRKPIEYIPSERRNKLDPCSLLNYGKLYIVDHNVKVWFVGRVHRNSEKRLRLDFNYFHPETKDSGPSLSSNCYDTCGQPQPLYPEPVSATCPIVQTSASKYEQPSTSEYPLSIPYSDEQAQSHYTSQTNTYPVSTSHGQAGSPSGANPAQYYPAQPPYESQGEMGGDEPDAEVKPSSEDGKQAVKRSDSSGAPRFPKSGQRFKPWTDEDGNVLREWSS